MPSPQKNQDEIEVEAIKTSEGTVPTLKGLNDVVNILYDDMKPLAKIMETTDDRLNSLSKYMKEMKETTKHISESLRDIILVLSKLNLNIEKVLSQKDIQSDTSMEKEILELKATLAKLITELAIDKNR